MRIFYANRTVLALSANAVLLLLILIAITTREGRVLGQSVAFPTSPAAPTVPAAPLTVMPCQLSQTTWGCYVMDPANQTLSVYQYLPHEELRLLAARDMQYDRRLKQYNTTPPRRISRQCSTGPMKPPGQHLRRCVRPSCATGKNK